MSSNTCKLIWNHLKCIIFQKSLIIYASLFVRRNIKVPTAITSIPENSGMKKNPAMVLGERRQQNRIMAIICIKRGWSDLNDGCGLKGVALLASAHICVSAVFGQETCFQSSGSSTHGNFDGVMVKYLWCLLCAERLKCLQNEGKVRLLYIWWSFLSSWGGQEKNWNMPG